MVTGTSDTSIDSPAHPLNNLLAQLDKMRDSGASPEERLRFLHENSSGFVKRQEPFDWNHAYDRDASLPSERMARLQELERDCKAIQQSWSTSSLSPVWRDLGLELLSHLGNVLKEVRSEESVREIDELSSLWTSCPDITDAFSDCVLTGWGSESKFRTRAREDRKKKEASPAAGKETDPKEDKEFQQLWELWQKGGISLDALRKLDLKAVRLHQETIKTAEERRVLVDGDSLDKVEEIEKIEQGWTTVVEPERKTASEMAQQDELHAERISHTLVDDSSAAQSLTQKLEHQSFTRKAFTIKEAKDEEEEGARKVVAPRPEPKPKPESDSPLDMKMMAKGWTEALNELTCDVWTYVGGGLGLNERHGLREEPSLMWRLGARTVGNVQWYARLDIGRDKEAYKVFMLINSPTAQRLWHEGTFSRKELDQLNADPRGFIEKVLEFQPFQSPSGDS